MMNVNDFSHNVIEINSEDYNKPINIASLKVKLKNLPHRTLVAVDSQNCIKGTLMLADLGNQDLLCEVKIADFINTVDNESRIEILTEKYKSDLFKLPFTVSDAKAVLDAHDAHIWHRIGYMQDYGMTRDSRRFLLRYITENFQKDAKILDIACGTGLMCFYLSEQGFNNLHGFDSIESHIAMAKEFSVIANKTLNFWVDDAFSPSIKCDDFDVAIFMGWVGCAGGFESVVSGKPLHETIDSLLTTYNFSVGTHVFLDVYDDLSNYELDKDKPTYRTIKFEDLKPVLDKHGFEVADKCYDCGYKIKIIYVLKKIR